MDDFESPEVQKDFPGLKEEPESKKEKEKKDKKDKKDKEKGYATLAGDSSQDEEGDTKSPGKSKRIKAFKFPLKKEKREKSKDKEVPASERDPGEGKEKKKDKKEKKDKKVKSSAADDPPQELGDVLPIFGVPLNLAVERGRCHDMDNALPLVVRDCIDYLQLQQDGIMNENIYKVEPAKAKLQHLRKLYNNRQSNGPQDLGTASTAEGLLRLFLKELPEPILTTELISQFEEVSAISNVQEQESQLKALIAQLPDANQTLLKWVFLHLDAVVEIHKMNAQLLAMILSQTLQMSHRLFVTILCHCRFLFSPTLLPRYIPPLAGANPVLPEARDDIIMELRKQESVLNQIHSEMNMGFRAGEEQLWEVQRIVTQLKRKLRQFDKKGDSVQKNIEDTVDSIVHDPQSTTTVGATRSPSRGEDVEATYILTISDTGFLSLPDDHPEATSFLQLQLENYELQNLKQQLQATINRERAEIIQLDQTTRANTRSAADEGQGLECDTVVQELYTQQAYLESIRVLLCEEVLKERKKVLDLRTQICLAGM